MLESRLYIMNYNQTCKLIVDPSLERHFIIFNIVVDDKEKYKLLNLMWYIYLPIN